MLGCDITIAASGTIKSLLQNEFPNLSFLELPGYKIAYSKTKRILPFKILIQVPKILRIIRFENKWLNNLLKENKFDAVISDNRFGLHTKETHTVFITHQLLIKTGFHWFDVVLQRINYNFINRYNECWIPDFKDNLNIAGELSHPVSLPKINLKYLGLLSRFSKQESKPIKYKWMAIISGPEPQRSIFEKKIFDVASTSKDSFLIVRGLPGRPEEDFKLPNCKVFNHLNTTDMQEAIEASEFIISRCGYTTVMEILSLQKKSVFIPTPGQTEQEYLAEHLLKQKWSYTFNQNEDFMQQIENAKSFTYSLPEFDVNLYKSVLTTFVNQLH